MSVTVFVLILLGVGCKKAQVTSYFVPKEDLAVSLPDGLDNWEVPKGWMGCLSTKPVLATFRVYDSSIEGNKTNSKGGGAIFTVVKFNESFWLDANVRRWAGQLGMRALDGNETIKAVSPIVIGGYPGRRVTLQNSDVDQKLLVDWVEVQGSAWFFKVTGNSGVVEKTIPALDAFSKNIRFNQHPLPGLESWRIPPDWKKGQPRTMVLKSFVISSEVKIQISRGDNHMGPFTLKEVRDYLEQGVLVPEDLATTAIEGLEGWISLSQLADMLLGEKLDIGKAGKYELSQLLHQLDLLLAHKGHSTSLFQVGSNYLNGEGVSKDLAVAYAWFGFAAYQGDNKASKQFKLLLNDMTESDIERGQEHLRGLLRKTTGIEVTISRAGGTLDTNLARWGEIMQLEIPEDPVEEWVKPIVMGGRQAHLVDMHNPDIKSRMIVVMVRSGEGGDSWFFKMLGHDKKTALKQDEFNAFIETIRFTEDGKGN